MVIPVAGAPAMDELSTAVYEGLLILTLNRPHKANALSLAMNQALAAALREARANPAVRGVLLTGAGERAFSGGVDMREVLPGVAPEVFQRQRSAAFFAVLLELADCEKPVVAAVNGAASGGGLMIAALADFIVAAEHASFALPEIDLGSPPLAGLVILAPLVGGALAYDLTQTARKLGAAEAAQRGLVRSVVAPADLVTSATGLVRELMGKNPRAYARSKRWMRASLHEALEKAEVEMVVYRSAAESA